MRALRIELRRGPGLLFFPIMLGLGTLMAWRQLSPWVATWPEAGAAVYMSTILVGPPTAGLAAWLAGRENRRGTSYLHDLADRPVTAPGLVTLGALMCWTALAYVAVAAAVCVRTFARDGWGHIDLLWIAVGATGLLIHPVVGFVAGRLISRAFVAPAVAVTVYLLEWFGAAKTGPGMWWGYLIPGGQILRLVDEDSSWLFSLGQGAWFIGLGITAWAAWSAVRTREHRGRLVIGGLVSGAALAVTGCAGIAAHPSPYGERMKFEYVCSGVQPTICLHPAYSKAMGPLRAAFAPLATRLQGTPIELRRLQQRVGSESVPAGTREIMVNELYAKRYAAMAVEQLVGDMTIGRCGESPVPGRPTDTNSVAYQSLVQSWLEGRDIRSLTIPDWMVAARDHFATLSPSGRIQWLKAHAKTVATCSLRASDFG